MNTPRSARRKSTICYKEEDSFVEDVQKSPIQPRPKRSVAKMSTFQTDSSSDSDHKMTNGGESSDNGGKLHKRLVLRSINESPSWNPTIVLTKLKNSDIENNYKSSPSVTDSSVRRGTRVRHKTTLVKEAEESLSLLKKLTVSENNKSDSESNENDKNLEKPSSLFTEEDVEGKQMFSFKMIHKKQDMLKKAIESILESPKRKNKDDTLSKGSRTPRTPKYTHKFTNITPRAKGRKSVLNMTPKSGKFNSVVDKTPHHIRNKMKKKLEILILSDNEVSDFEDSGSDFQPSEDDSQSSDEAENDGSDDSNIESSQSEDEQIEKANKKKQIVKATHTKIPSSLKRVCREKDANYIVKSDDYFSMHSSKKVVTSNHTLERLKTPRLTEDKLQTILKEQKLSDQHRIAIEELIEDHEKLFDKWVYILSEGFSVLLHGVGSKQKLIKDFQMQKLSAYPCIVINGFFPSLTMKDILESIMIDLLEFNSVPSNVFEAIKLIEEEMALSTNTHLFLLVHNIDGTMLRNNKTQSVLSKLAKIKNIHLIASVDHINTPLIWDHSVFSDYNFSWWDVTTLLPYTQETAFESSLMVHKSGALALSSLENVFQSLTTNARGIFMIIVKNQLKNIKIPHYQGMSFKDLYWSAREAFLVSSDLALRAQLTEFLDHKLVKTKRTADGIENLIIPINNSLLQQFVEQNDS